MVTVSTNTVHDEAHYSVRPRCVHTITDRFSLSNTYLIVEDRLLVVDPGSETHVRLLLKYIRTFLHRSPDEIDLIVLTHLHPEHTNGVEFLRRFCAAPVAASSVALALSQSAHAMTVPRITHLLPGTLHHLDIFSVQYTQQVKFVDMWLHDVGGLPFHPDWRVIASSGHTPESLCLYNPFTHELLCGDTLATLNARTPLLRRGVNRRLLDETLHVLRSLPVRYLYPGHGQQIIGETPLANIQVEW